MTDASPMPMAFGEALLLGSALLVFLMQGGFCALEAGVVRSKNAVHVAVKNLIDLFVSVGCFWALGFGLAFGASCGGWFGLMTPLPTDWDGPGGIAFFIYQIMFCGAAATIVSGAVTERIRTRAYLYISTVLAAVVYPLAAHWAWAFDASGPTGWLGRMGFIDYSGSTIIHGLGAWCALAVILQLGPRRGRFDTTGPVGEAPISGNLVLSSLGALVLWFGWFGFNAGNAFQTPDLIAKIVLNTLIAPVAGGGVIVLWQTLTGRMFSLRDILAATIGSLVAITAGCHLVDARGAFAIGLVGAAVAVAVAHWIERRRIDDPLDVIACHGAAGVWGTLALVLFAPAESLSMGRLEQFGVQLVGVATIAVFSFTTMSFATWAWRCFGPLRVAPHAEVQGLNVVEHGARSEFWDLLSRARSAASCRVGAEHGRAEVDDFSEYGMLRDTLEQLIESSETQRTALESRIDVAHSETVEMLVDLAECRDTETAAHIRRLKLYCDVLAQELAYATPEFRRTIDTEFIASLSRASVLHDVGKVGIPDNVLLKPGRFTPEERAIMETHTSIGAEILERARYRTENPPAFLTMAAKVARSHHEWYDGNGYPDGLRGEAIPLAARIVAVADVFDALISKRVYKEAFTAEDAKAVVLGGSSTQFDPEVVAAFTARFDDLLAIHEMNRERQDAPEPEEAVVEQIASFI